MSDDPIASIRARLRRFKGKYPDICARSDLQYSWLSKFASGERGARPSFELITKLDAVLTEMEGEAPRTTDPNPPVRRTTAAQGATAEAAQASVLTATASRAGCGHG